MEELISYVKAINDKVEKTSQFKSLMFLVKYNSVLEGGADTSMFTYNFYPPIELDSLDYEIALMDIETYYSIPNIDAKNNQFSYFNSHSRARQTITVDTGTYDIPNLNIDLNQQLPILDRNKITFAIVPSTLHCSMTLQPAYWVDFSYANTFNKLLGFDAKMYENQSNTKRIYVSENLVDIMPINSVYVNCDLINNSYVNGKHSTAIYSFFPNVAPGAKIVEKAINLVFLPINRTIISSVTVWLSDQDGNRINFRGENISMRFYLRKTPLN